MPVEILMPALSSQTTHAKLARWRKREGQDVQSGEVIAEVESDKATLEVEAPQSGKLASILISDGSADIAIGQVIALLLLEGETLDQVPEPPPQAATTRLTMREALRDAIAEEMRLDRDVFFIGEAIGGAENLHKVSQGLLEEFGVGRLIDTLARQQGTAGLAIGAAMAGLKPVVEFTNWNYGMAAIDQIINSAAKIRYISGGLINMPIVFRGPHGATSRGGAQHGHDFASGLSHCPGLKVVVPSNAADAKGLLKAAIRDPNPVIVLETESLYARADEVPNDTDHIVPIGMARVLRSGHHVTITAFAAMVDPAMKAAQILQGEGIEAEIIDLRCLRPLDSRTIVGSVQKTNRLVSVEAGWPQSGIGAELSALMMEQAFDYLDAPVARITGKDTPLPYAANLEQLALPLTSDIVDAVRRVCYRAPFVP